MAMAMTRMPPLVFQKWRATEARGKSNINVGSQSQISPDEVRQATTYCTGCSMCSNRKLMATPNAAYCHLGAANTYVHLQASFCQYLAAVRPDLDLGLRIAAAG